MRSEAKDRRESRLRQHHQIRRHLNGTEARPRLAVFRSHMHIYLQLVDDVRGVTLVGASSLSSELRETLKGKSKSERGKEVGKLIAARAAQKGIKQVTFDRGGYRYHGRIKAVAEGAREGGLEF